MTAALALAACGGGGGGDAAVAPPSGPASSSAPVVVTTRAAASAATTASTGTGSGSGTGSESGSAAASEGYDPSRNAAADLAAAKKAAAKDGRPVLVDFGADWCPDCVVLGHTFTEPATAALLAKYHVVKVDVGEFDHNLDVAGRYVDLDTSGIPALVVLAPSGATRTATNDGQFSNARSMPASEVDAFLKKWA